MIQFVLSPTRMSGSDEQVESVMAKLGIERRVQYGAEKMLDVCLSLMLRGKLTRIQVIEQRSGAENNEMKERITAQLEAAANRIRNLESQLERLRGGRFYSSCSREVC